MMTIRVKVKRVDHDGFNGRDHHPTDTHVGMEGVVNNLDLVSGAFVGDESNYQIFYVTLDNSDIVELMGHEIELVSCTHDGDL